MEIKNVFISILVAFVVSFAFASFASYLNTAYGSVSGSGNIDTGFQDTFEPILDYTTQMSDDVENTTSPKSFAASPGDVTQLQSRSTFTIILGLVDFAPSLIDNAANFLGIPQVYRQIAKVGFIFVFVLGIIYLLYLGVVKYVF